MENRYTLEYIYHNEAILESLFNAINNSNDHLISIELLKLLIDIIKSALVESFNIPEYEENKPAEGEEEDIVSVEERALRNTNLGKLILVNFDKILRRFDFENDSTNTSINTTTDSVIRPLGSMRLKIVEYVSVVLNYFKNIKGILDRSLIETNFMKLLFKYFFEYEWNNFYQLLVEQLLKNIFANLPNFPELKKFLFEKDQLDIIGLILSKSEDSLFTFNSNNKIMRGYWATLIELSFKLNQIEDNYIKEKFNDEWNGFINDKVKYFINLFEKKLCYNDNFNFVSIDKLNNVEESGKEGQEANENPFKSKDEEFLKNDDDWLHEDKFSGEINEEILENLDGFEFVDENNDTEKRLHEGEALSYKESAGEFSDNLYWKYDSVIDENELANALKDLDL